MKIKNYNPLKLIIGLWAIAVAVRRHTIAMRENRLPKTEDFYLKNDNCIVANNHFSVDKNFNSFVELIKLEFKKKENSNGIITVVSNKFVSGYELNGSAYYLSNAVLPLFDIIQTIESSELFNRLQQHIGCSFYCRSINVFKTNSTQNGSTSTFFHRDGHPPFSYKILVYLTDVLNINCGPTAIIKGSTKNVVPGWGRYTYDRPFAEAVYRENVILGKFGTAILFSTNVLHAGGRMLEGERIVMTVQLVPKYSKDISSLQSCSLFKPGSREYDL